MNRLLFWLCVALWLGVFIWAGVICYLSSLSGSEVEKILSVPIWDKLAHFIAFAAGAGLLGGAISLSKKHWSALKVILITVLTISTFGAIDEWHQLYTPQRSGADRYDWMADTLGALAGSSAVCLFIYARRHSRKAPPAPAGD